MTATLNSEYNVCKNSTLLGRWKNYISINIFLLLFAGLSLYLHIKYFFEIGVEYEK